MADIEYENAAPPHPEAVFVYDKSKSADGWSTWQSAENWKLLQPVLGPKPEETPEQELPPQIH